MRILIRDFIINSGFQSGFRAGGTCYSSALRDVMSYYDFGSDIPESDLFFLINGLNIMFYDDEKKGLLGYDSENIENMSFFGDKCNITSFRKREKNREQILETISKRLRNNEPIICFIETAYLDYHSIYQKNESGIHAITVFGIDTDRDSCYVLDSHIRINFECFENYMGELSLTRLIDGLLCIWEFDTMRYSDLDKKELWENIIKGIKNYIEGGCINNKIYCGSSALENYLKNCRGLSEQADKQALLNLCNVIHYQIKISGPCYITNNLSLLCGRLGNTLKKNKEDFDALNAEWVQLAAAILASGYRGSQKKFDDALIKAEELVQKQIKVICDLLDRLEEGTEKA